MKGGFLDYTQNGWKEQHGYIYIDHHQITLEAFPFNCGPFKTTSKNDLVVINGHSPMHVYL